MNKYFNDGHINPAIQEYTIEYRYDSAPLHTIKYINDGGLELCYEKKSSSFEIKKVHFNDPATIVLWADGTKTVVKCGEEDIYDPQTGLLMCIAKKMYGNTGKFNDILREWVPEPEVEEFDIIGAIHRVTDMFNKVFGLSCCECEEPEPEVTTNNWIPCSVAVPSCEDYYLVTIKSFENPCIRKWYADGWHSQYEVLAWMPMPNTYEEARG